MALFRLGTQTERPHIICGEGLLLRPFESRDFDQWASLREKSRDFLTPWEPTWNADDLTRTAFRRRVRRNEDEIARDETYPMLIFREPDGTLLGGLTLGQVRRGVSQTATLGYWMGELHAGQGLMSKAVRLASIYAFAHLRLHRLEAACLPTNMRSIRLLERAGFQREGIARSYLRINGIWQDHVLYARLDSDPAPPMRDTSAPVPA